AGAITGVGVLETVPDSVLEVADVVVLVDVSPDELTARLAGQLNVRWHAVYVETPRLQRLAAAERDRILAVLKLAEELGAATAVLTGDDVAAQLAEQARRLNCATLVLG
ncbi:hypothetical protein ACEN8K_45555, partial [Variovorax sp. CT11-76]